MQFSFRSLCVLTLTTPLLFSQTALAQSDGDQRPDRMFSRIDTNNDGFIDQAEADVMIERVIGRVDTDNDGAVSEEEVQKAQKKMRRHHAKKHRGHRGQRGHKWFSRVDTDGDGVITRLEFDIAGVKQRARMFAELDQNGDGVLTRVDRSRDGDRGKHSSRDHRSDKHGKKRADAQDGDQSRREGGRIAVLFERFDADKNGVLSRAEVEADVEGVRMSKERRLQIFERVDADKDGNVTQEEISTLREKAKAGRRGNRGQRQAFIVQRFGEIDANGDKSLSAEEIAQAKVTFFEEADSDKDGKLSPDELRAQMKKQRSAN